MSRPVICQICRKKFIREETGFAKTSKGYMHKECYESSQKEKETRTQIFELLEELTPERVNYALVSKQLKTFTEEYGLNESGILGTLVFMHKIRNIRTMPEKGIAFVPYKYQEAREFFEKKAQLEEIEAVKMTETVVKIREPKLKQKTIKLSSLLEGE